MINKTRNKMMIKIKLVVPKLLMYDQNIKGHTQVLNLEYNNPVTVDQVLKDKKINMHFLGFMVLNGNKNVNKNFLIEESCELKLFLLMAGG